MPISTRISQTLSVVIACGMVFLALPGCASLPDTPGIATIQDTPSGSAVCPVPISSVTLRYYIGYNVATGDAIDGFAPVQVVELEGDEFAEISGMLGSLRKIQVQPDSEEYSLLMYDELKDEYELSVDGRKLLLGEEFGMYEATDGEIVLFKCRSLSERINKIAAANTERATEALGGGPYTITKASSGKSIDVQSGEALQTLSSWRFYEMRDILDDKLGYVIDLHDGRVLDVHFASCLGTMHEVDGTEQCVYLGSNMSYMLEDLFRKN